MIFISYWLHLVDNWKCSLKSWNKIVPISSFKCIKCQLNILLQSNLHKSTAGLFVPITLTELLLEMSQKVNTAQIFTEQLPVNTINCRSWLPQLWRLKMAFPNLISENIWLRGRATKWPITCSCWQIIYWPHERDQYQSLPWWEL